ncbi:unnamed protein product [Didymodactylos carnosus]|uniref:NADH:ubiquinone oxidoreductase intermediate-associated protein 30 domain-containing protein n=1 Tax=Didymodactylos carnosus TaxID=1234261 RepID=A0A815A4L5_9BILA|nr:unnamed protein product [Didymodactylos carnosus]CAF4022565.1 unnamed protein product [Didymodactylos carnosus]
MSTICPSFKNEKTLFNFTTDSASINDWQEISDTERDVGKSKATFVLQKTQQFQRAIFFTLLNPQSNGAGFGGVAYRKQTFDLSAYDGLKLNVRAQGECYNYKIILRHHHQESSLDPSYEIFFELPKNQFTEIYLSFDNFKPYSRGKALDPSKVPLLDRSDVTSIGLQVYGGVYSPIKQQGSSSLEIDYINTVQCTSI